ncbi:MAG: carbon storage regulator CsrA [Proteobacteria bacterium]|nr:carbon storage regulator CsrA [Pseudomonadota bacterium]MBU1639856.1 carbon storage regulator CsrA [Pseudomonadota bacterium]
MLILARKIGEAITIADEITIKVIEIKGGQVKIGIEAPPHVSIHRNEVYEKIVEENKKAALDTPTDLSSLADFFKDRT